MYLAKIAASICDDDNLIDKIAGAPEMAAFLNEQDITSLQVIGKGGKCGLFPKKFAVPPVGASQPAKSTSSS